MSFNVAQILLLDVGSMFPGSTDRYSSTCLINLCGCFAIKQLSMPFNLPFFFREDNIKSIISIKLIIFEFWPYFIIMTVSNGGPATRIYYSPSQCAEILVFIKTVPVTYGISCTGEIHITLRNNTAKLSEVKDSCNTLKIYLTRM